MTDGEAIAALGVPRETIKHLASFVELLTEENARQNLISRATVGDIWSRHILDSAQLTKFAPKDATSWLDLGSGAGFPGLIIALLHRSRVTLVEGRRLRADFLTRAAVTLGVDAHIICGNAAEIEAGPFEVISARALAPLDKLFSIGERFSTSETCWILPKGRSAKSELEAAQASWQGNFRLEPSLTDPDAKIIVAEQVRRKPRGKCAR